MSSRRPPQWAASLSKSSGPVPLAAKQKTRGVVDASGGRGAEGSQRAAASVAGSSLSMLADTQAPAQAAGASRRARTLPLASARSSPTATTVPAGIVAASVTGAATPAGAAPTSKPSRGGASSDAPWRMSAPRFDDTTKRLARSESIVIRAASVQHWLQAPRN